MSRIIFSLTDAQADALLKAQRGEAFSYSWDRTVIGLRDRGLLVPKGAQRGEWALTPAGKLAASLAAHVRGLAPQKTGKGG